MRKTGYKGKIICVLEINLTKLDKYFTITAQNLFQLQNIIIGYEV